MIGISSSPYAAMARVAIRFTRAVVASSRADAKLKAAGTSRRPRDSGPAFAGATVEARHPPNEKGGTRPPFWFPLAQE